MNLGPEAKTSSNGAPKPLLASLLIQCSDQKGVVAALAQLLYGFGCNILESDQYTDTSTAVYFQRLRLTPSLPMHLHCTLHECPIMHNHHCILPTTHVHVQPLFLHQGVVSGYVGFLEPASV